MNRNSFYSIISFFFIGILCVACKHKCYAVNMLGEGNIDVTRYVESGYKPVYCPDHEKVCKLINPHPIPLADEEIMQVRVFLVKNGIDVSIENSALRRQLKYTSSYFITWYPVDCFVLNFDFNGKKVHLEVRKEYDNRNSNDRLILPDPSEFSTRFMIQDDI